MVTAVFRWALTLLQRPHLGGLLGQAWFEEVGLRWSYPACILPPWWVLPSLLHASTVMVF